MDRKRAQMTVFIVLGLVLLAVVSLAIYLRVNVMEGRVGNLEEQVELSTQRTALSLMVDSCLRSKAVKAIELYGVDESAEQLITNFIEYEMLPCIDVSPFTNEGIRVYNDEGYVTIEISENAVAVQMHLPLTLVKEDSRATLDDFSFTLQKIRYVSLPTDADGKMQETYSFTAPNNRAEITIPENTIVKKDNVAVDSQDMISMRLVDRNYMAMENTLSIGEIMYLMESGISFSPAATMTLYYNEEELPPWEKEEDLTLSVYNEVRGIWEVLPSRVEVDKDRIIAEIEHFSLFTITSNICSDNAGNDQVISSGLIFKERCRPCEGAVYVEEGMYAGELYFEGEDVKYYATPEFGEEHEECGGEPCCYLNDWDHDEPGRDETTDAASKSQCEDDGGEWDAVEGACLVHVEPTPRTFGYADSAHVGGKATYTFYTVEGTGDVCTNNNTRDVDVDIFTSPGDEVPPASITLNNQHLVIGHMGPEQLTVLSYPRDLRHGMNVMEFDVENANNDGCAKAQVMMTMRGAGFLPECHKNVLLESNCVCGQQNVNVGGSEHDFFCCAETEVIVEDDPSKCIAAYNPCPFGNFFLGAAQHGCFCGGDTTQQYDHYSPDAKHYCCGEGGLSAGPCNSCPRTGERLSEDCLCGGVIAEQGQWCCYTGRADFYLPFPEECELEPRCGSGSSVPPATQSAVILDVTGMTIGASGLCTQQVGLWEDILRHFAISWCDPVTRNEQCLITDAVCGATFSLSCQAAVWAAGGDWVLDSAELYRCQAGTKPDWGCTAEDTECCVNHIFDEIEARSAQQSG